VFIHVLIVYQIMMHRSLSYMTFVLMTHEKQLFFCRRFNPEAVTNLNIKLSYESWEDVLSYNDVNMSFNKFLNIYLTIFFSSFPTKAAHNSSHSKVWLTQGIRISCRNKRKLYLVSRQNLDQNKKFVIKYIVRYWQKS